MIEHKYTSYRPEWCQHPPFDGVDYCWGLACSVDDDTLDEFLKDKCKGCEYSEYYEVKDVAR